MFKWVLLLSLPILGMADQDSQSDVQEEQTDEYIENEQIWIGPGLYYGIWFDNEEDYGEWQRNHGYEGRGERRRDRRGDRRHDGDHHGGDHHHEGGGGHGGGGGHHGGGGGHK